MTLEQIDAAIAALEAARTKQLTGRQPIRVGYTNGSVEFSATKIEDINAEIARLLIMRSKLTGCASGYGPIRVGFGIR